MKLMKKTFAFLMLFVCAAVLVACNKKDPDLEAKADTIYLGDTSEQTDDLVLPKFASGDPDYKITWASSDPDVIAIKEFETFEGKDTTKYIKGYVELSDTEKTVTLTATVEHNGNRTKRDFEVTVMKDEYEKMSVADAKKAGEKDKLIRIDGTVCYTTSSGYVVTDGKDAMYVYGSGHGKNVGDVVIVRGKWALYNNMPQMSSAAAKVINQDAEFTLASVATDATVGDLASLTISSSGADAEGCTIVRNITARVLDNSSDSYNPIRLSDPKDPSKYVGVTKYNDDDTKNGLKNYIGKDITATVITYYGYKGEWSVLVDLSSVKETQITFTDAEKVNATKILLENKYNGTQVNNDLTLEATSTYGATIAWTSGNSDIIGNDGKFTAPAVDTEVKLTATITCNQEIATAEVTVKALAPQAVEMKDITAVGFYVVNGTLVGKYGQGFLVSDGTAVMCVYLKSETTYAVGQGLRIAGMATQYNGNFQFDNTAVITENADAPKPAEQSPAVWGAAECEAYLESGKVGNYVTIQGTLSVSGNYFNITIDGTTKAIGSIESPLAADKAALTALNGKTIKVTGYTTRVSSSKYVNLCVVSFEEVK